VRISCHLNAKNVKDKTDPDGISATESGKEDSQNKLYVVADNVISSAVSFYPGVDLSIKLEHIKGLGKYVSTYQLVIYDEHD